MLFRWCRFRAAFIRRCLCAAQRCWERWQRRHDGAMLCWGLFTAWRDGAPAPCMRQRRDAYAARRVRWCAPRCELLRQGTIFYYILRYCLRTIIIFSPPLSVILLLLFAIIAFHAMLILITPLFMLMLAFIIDAAAAAIFTLLIYAILYWCDADIITPFSDCFRLFSLSISWYAIADSAAIICFMLLLLIIDITIHADIFADYFPLSFSSFIDFSS